MGDVVNLRQARKQKERAAKEQQAERNRAVHGRPKAERERDDKLAQKAERFIEGHRRDSAPDTDDER